MRKVLESALFISGRKLSLQELCSVSNSSESEVKKEILSLKNEYSARESPIEIVEDDEGNFKMELKLGYLNKVKTLAPHMDMNRALLTTLSYIAYKQPIKQSILVKRFGNRIYEYVRELEKRAFIHAEFKHRTKVLTITKKLLTYIGEDDIQKLKGAVDAAKLEQQLQKELEQKEIEEAFAPKKRTRRKKQELVAKRDMSIDEWTQLIEEETAQKLAKQQSSLPGIISIETPASAEEPSERKKEKAHEPEE